MAGAESKLKQRIVGALVLIALAVIFYRCCSSKKILLARLL